MLLITFMLSAIDNCSPNPCINGTCQSTADSFKCVCDIGYELANDKLTCNRKFIFKMFLFSKYFVRYFINIKLISNNVSNNMLVLFVACNEYTYGYNCNMTCGCVQGKCNAVKGCICNDGYTGTRCENTDFCAGNISKCEDKMSECVNEEQNYTCVCKAGYSKNESGICASKFYIFSLFVLF